MSTCSFSPQIRRLQTAKPERQSSHVQKCARSRVLVRASAEVSSSVAVRGYGSASLQGTSRKQNEDRRAVQVAELSENGQPEAYAAVFDGHGGNSVSIWLEKNFLSVIDKYWQDGNAPEACVSQAFIQADKRLLAPQGGFLGMGERGVGGSKCGSTAAMVLVYRDLSGKPLLLTANAGDARVLLGRGKEAVQLTEDHVPDSEKERRRIERENPNPKMPLVRYVGGTWRVGGILALSRAFGDAYMKGSLQFEGVPSGGDGYSSGFGVVAQPHTTITELTGEESWVVLASDGLFANEERGGGGGLSNEEVIAMCNKMGGSSSCDQIAEALAKAAVEDGSTDDVTVVVLKMN